MTKILTGRHVFVTGGIGCNLSHSRCSKTLSTHLLYNKRMRECVQCLALSLLYLGLIVLCIRPSVLRIKYCGENRYVTRLIILVETVLQYRFQQQVETIVNFHLSRHFQKQITSNDPCWERLMFFLWYMTSFSLRGT